MVSAPLIQVGVFLAAAAIAALLGRFTRMGAVLGYLAAVAAWRAKPKMELEVSCSGRTLRHF